MPRRSNPQISESLRKALVELFYCNSKQPQTEIGRGRRVSFPRPISAFSCSCLEPVSKFRKMHFRHISLHFRVAFPRFTDSKPSSKRLELQADMLETAHSSF